MPLKQVEDTEEAYWLKEARAHKLDVSAEWCMAWIPNAWGASCEGEFVGTYKPSDKSDAKFSFVLAVPPGTVAILDDFEFWKE